MESGDDSEVLTLKKFRGDLAYRRREYEVGVNMRQTTMLAMGACSTKLHMYQACARVGVCSMEMELVFRDTCR